MIGETFNLFLTTPLTNGIVLFYHLFGSNLGVAIILFTIVLRFALNPLTKPYMESMKRMRRYSAELTKVKNRHKGDRAKQAKAQADFYKEKGLNPSAGCIPYALQFVVLIALFRVFTGVLAAEGDVTENFNKVLYTPLRFEEGESVNTRFLYLDLAKPDVFALPQSPIPLPGFFLLASSIVQLVSSKIAIPYLDAERKASKKTAEKTDDFQVAMQSSMVYTIPFITILFGVGLPSGLALYWLVFSLFQMYQQYESYGWGGATPWLARVGLVEYVRKDEQRDGKRNRGKGKRAS